jgi:hypothetical protein
MAKPPLGLSIKANMQCKAPTRKPAPLTTEEKKEKQKIREATNTAIAADVDEWFSYTMSKVKELAEKHHKKPRYFQDIFFSGGAHMIHERGANAWNAFVSMKADEVNSGTSYI